MAIYGHLPHSEQHREDTWEELLHHLGHVSSLVGFLSRFSYRYSSYSQVVGGMILFIVFMNVGGREGNSISSTAQLITSIAFTLSLVVSFCVFLTLPKPANTNDVEVCHSKTHFLEELCNLSSYSLVNFSFSWDCSPYVHEENALSRNSFCLHWNCSIILDQ